MENKYLIFQLAAYLGTPSFYNLLGDLIKEESKSEKVIIVRSEGNQWVVLDSKGYIPEKLAYDTLEELLVKLNNVKVLKFPFNTYILFDGNLQDSILIKYLGLLFEKEEELFEKYRLESIIDRLSYQLSGIENIVKTLGKKMKEEDFLETLLSSISEMFFSTVGLYSYEDLKLIMKFGSLNIPEELEFFDHMLDVLNKGQNCTVFKFTEEQKAYYDVFYIKYIVPYFKNGSLKYLLTISRDTNIEKEENEVFETITKITKFLYEENAI
ncbi:hypothetical protein [Marinitoga sp. 38H-ov]|uniref:hypothetical protein n=1 Tax=Marinitoga sp. 38H-ov TaxID=1755814 RepID=UPI0013EBC4B2|nr:hypothetical protein [Marinitoga sp. 38H-ov]KAF2955176.1 hypothetical protein AS160_01355 [Marinitoga sp. 38H-ov]